MAKVMLVEDDNNLREIYEARLAAEGYAIVSAHDGEEALALAVKERPDLIISDVMMPKISGFDMLDILRSTPETRHTKVIMMTALSQAEDRDRADKLGADRYLVKSQVTLEDVIKVANDILNDIANPSPSVPAATQTPVPVISSPAADQTGSIPVVTAPPEPPAEPVSTSTPEPTQAPVAEPPAQPVVPPQPTPPPVASTLEPPKPEPEITDTPANQDEPVAPPPPAPTPPATQKVTIKTEDASPDTTDETTVGEPTPEPEETPTGPFEPPTKPDAPVVPAPETNKEVHAEQPVEAAEATALKPDQVQTKAEETQDVEQQIQDFVTNSPMLNTATDAPTAKPAASASTSIPVVEVPEKDTTTPATETEKPETSDTDPTPKSIEPPSHKKLVIQPTSNATAPSVNLDELLAKEQQDEGINPPATDTIITPASPPSDQATTVDPSQIAL